MSGEPGSPPAIWRGGWTSPSPARRPRARAGLLGPRAGPQARISRERPILQGRDKRTGHSARNGVRRRAWGGGLEGNQPVCGAEALQILHKGSLSRGCLAFRDVLLSFAMGVGRNAEPAPSIRGNVTPCWLWPLGRQGSATVPDSASGRIDALAQFLGGRQILPPLSEADTASPPHLRRLMSGARLWRGEPSVFGRRPKPGSWPSITAPAGRWRRRRRRPAGTLCAAGSRAACRG